MNYKEMFNEWYNTKYSFYHTDLVLSAFYALPKTMQQGVYREFFESKGILIEVFTSKPKLTFGYKVVNEGGDLLDDGFPDYNTAFNTAIETAEKVLEWVK